MCTIAIMKALVFWIVMGIVIAEDFAAMNCGLYSMARVTELKLVPAASPAIGIDATFKFETALDVDDSNLYIVFLHFLSGTEVIYSAGKEFYFDYPSTITDQNKLFEMNFNFHDVTDLSNVVAFEFWDNDATNSIQVGSFGGGKFNSSEYSFDSFYIEKSDRLDYHYAQTRESTCLTPVWKQASIAFASGDPHFRTWNGDEYDFMGGCDLVLIQNVVLSTGDRLDIHIRTVVENWWSSISAVAFQIGSDTFEVSTNDGLLYVNGAKEENFKFLHSSLKIQSFHQNFTSLRHHFTHVLLDDDVDVMHLNGVHGAKQEMSVMLHSGRIEAYLKSSGLMGLYPTGELVGRDGVTVFENKTEFAEHWRVKKDFDPVLFSSQAEDSSNQCVYPTEVQGKPLVSKEIAMTVCKGKEGEKMCIKDVMASGDFELAYLYDDSLQMYKLSVDVNEAMKVCSDAGEFVSLCFKEVLATQDVTIGEKFKMIKSLNI